jgi:hypothetical protein
MRKAIGFYHVALMCDWLTLLKTQVAKLHKFSLINSGSSGTESLVYLCAVGPKKEYNRMPQLHPRIIPIHISDNIHDYEHPTIEKLHNMAKEEDFYCFYFHTKGVSLPLYKNDKEKLAERFHKPHIVKRFGKPSYDELAKNTLHWRLFLEYFTIQKWTDNVLFLERFDCVGPRWIKEGFPHFSGNFWWANSEYLRKLESVYTFPFTQKDYRFRSEAWIGQNPNVKVKSLSKLKMHYYDSLPPRAYK